VVNEEHAGNGTLDLVARGQRADAALVLEPTECRLFVTAPGGLYWELEVPGVPTSPGARWQGTRQVGVSAVEKLPAAIEALLGVERAYNARPAIRSTAAAIPSRWCWARCRAATTRR
jgi:acetylornithine deacetylase